MDQIEQRERMIKLEPIFLLNHILLEYESWVEQIELELGRPPTTVELQIMLKSPLGAPEFKWEFEDYLKNRCECRTEIGDPSDVYPLCGFCQSIPAELRESLCHPHEMVWSPNTKSSYCMKSGHPHEMVWSPNTKSSYCMKCGMESTRPMFDEADFDTLNARRHNGVRNPARSLQPPCSVKTVRGHQCTFPCQPGSDKCRRHLNPSRIDPYQLPPRWQSIFKRSPTLRGRSVKRSRTLRGVPSNA